MSRETLSLPESLRKWKTCNLGQEMHQSWVPLAPWLLQEGILLFDLPTHAFSCIPPDHLKRDKEPGLYTVVEDEHWAGYQRVQQQSALVHPARDGTGRWVMLRAVRLGTEGTCHRDILRFLSSYPQRADSRNHCLPVLRELETSQVTIAVFPMMSIGSIYIPWFFSFAEVLEFIIQIAEGLTFMHENRIAHRDISEDNIVLNLAGPPYTGSLCLTPWRSRFPIRYFFIDLELAIKFEHDGDPSRFVTKGPPSQFYGREAAPEVYGNEEYDPFAADVFSLGLVLWRLFQLVDDPEFLDLIEEMLAVQPLERPTATEVLCTFHAYRDRQSAQTLGKPVPQQTASGVPNRIHPNAFQPQRG